MTSIQLSRSKRAVFRFLSLSTAAGIALGSAGSAQGQASGESGLLSLEQIIVTAQKRAERLLETPLSVSAFTSTAIERLGVSSIQQLSEFAPNVVFDPTSPISGASNAAAIFIRGIGQSDFALTTEAGVGTYVDGVYMSRSFGGVLDVLDIERLEILRGPQGTLFGRNTIGGAINIASKRPGPEFEGEASITLGDADRIDLRTSVNLPVSDTLGIRLAGSSKDRNGFVRTNPLIDADQLDLPLAVRPTVLGDSRDLGEENRQAVRAVIAYDPSPQLKFTLIGDYARVREDNAANTLIAITGDGPAAAMAVGAPGFLAADPDQDPVLDSGPIVTLYNLTEGLDPTISPDQSLLDVVGALFPNTFYTDGNFLTGDMSTTFGTGPLGTAIDAWGVSLTIDWQAFETVSIKSITAYRETSGFFNRDADGSPLTITHTRNFGYRHEQFSQELQLTGTAASDRLQFVGGLFYFTEQGSDPIIVEFPSSFGTLFQDVSDIDNNSFAAYAQATFDITDAFSVTGGVRYTRDKKKFALDAFIVPGFANPFPPFLVVDGIIPILPLGSVAEETYEDVSPRVALEYQWSDDFLTYASYTQGFKSGGFNLRYVLPVAGIIPFDPEEVDSVEIGLKWQGMNERVRITAAGFYTDYANVQLTIFENFGAPLTLNAGDAEIWGAEFEVTAVPFENFQISASLGYLDAEYTNLAAQDPDVLPVQQITPETALANTPEFTTAIMAEYVTSLGNAGDLEFHIDWRYTDDIFNDAQNSPFLFQEGYHLVNASVTFLRADGRWSLRFFVDNLTDARYILSGDSNFGIGFHQANFNRPREWGLTGKVTF